MKHRFKASLVAIVIVHIVLGGAAIHAAIGWVFGNHEHDVADSSNQIPNDASPGHLSAKNPIY
jgi:hypothetical protein